MPRKPHPSLKQLRKDHPELEVHHRKAKANGGLNNLGNLKMVSPELHVCYNLLFGGSATPQEICKILNTWIDPEFCLIVCKPRNSHRRRK